ncbi:hypothetical protein EC957_001060 [Mortierella hygrophila]|uniref:Uncharacterized protein n=1 Tax=Mortierella hygrophila TaxID=979708 RepID=A0A9P6F6T0_9FUNG|nr:hypothetical protein EC957_001060 [Mortierella hygrophila]
MEVLTIQQQEALLPAIPSTTGGHYPSALEGTGHQQVIDSTGRGRGRVVYDHNKPLPAIVAEGESDEDDGHSSNINNRPASNEPAQEEGATSTAGATNTALTIEQFKWSMICCCNEIKTRVFKQQQQQRLGSLQDDAPHAPPSLGQKPFPDSHNPYSGAAALPPTASSNKKADKNKSRSSNGNGGNNGNNSGSGSGHLSSASNSYNTAAAIEQAAQESRATLQALLMIMTSSSSSMGTEKDRDGLDPTVLASNVQAYRGSNATAGSQSQNQSLLSLIGTGGGVSMSATGAAPPMRSHSSHHLSRYSSHSVLLTGPTTTPGGQPSTGGAPTTPLRNNKSQSGMANSYAQATNTILNPLSLQDLALLLAYLLSIAPEQWIPWHLYDFFVRPQGRSYKDLIEMMPTHSQRILKALLETVEALIDYATITGLQYQRALSQQQQQQSGPAGKQLTLAHLRSRSDVDPGHSRNNGGYGVGANPMLRSAGSSMLSLAKALTILEPPFSAQELQQLQQQQQQQQMKQQQTGLHTAARGGDMVHQEIALRGRKRRVILDSLSGLVFRPRANESHRGDGGAVGAMGVLIESPTEGGGGGLLSPEEKGNGGKGKAMRRRSFLGAATSIASSGSSTAAAGGPSPAAVALQLQMSEREREASHLAFDNLVSAFETEFVRPLPSFVAGSGTSAKASATTTMGGVEAGTEFQDELPNVTLPQSLAAAGSVARIRSSASAAVVPGQGTDRSFTLPSTLRQQQPSPRQARSLPTAVSAPTDLAAVRSLSLPPWRKTHHSALQLGQHPPPSVSPSVASAARQEWLPQYAFQSQSSSQQQQQLPPLPPRSSVTAATGIGAGQGPVPLNRVLAVSTKSIVKSPSEELTETLQKQPPVVEPAPVSASGSTTTLPAVVQSLAIAGAPVSVRALGLRSGSVVASQKAPGDLDAEQETVEVRLRGGVVSPRSGPAVVTSAPATLPRRTSQRSSTRKTRPMSLDNGQDSASLSSSKLLRTRTLSGTISSTWTEWKDHLLVLEEEEYLIEDSSESPSISSFTSDSEDSFLSDSEDEVSEGGKGSGGHDNEHGHEHDDHADDGSGRRKEKSQERRRRKDRQEGVTPDAAGGAEDGRRTNKSSGTFGDLRALAAAIAASQQRQQQQTQQQRAGGSGAGGVV